MRERERVSLRAAASSGAAASSAAAGGPAAVENTATSEWPRVNAVKEVFVSPHGSKFHIDRQCQYLKRQDESSFFWCLLAL